MAKFNITKCPVCGNEHFSAWKQVPDWLVSKEEFTISSCTACSFKFTSNAPLPENAGPYYNSEEYVEHSDTKKGLYRFYHMAREVMLRYKFNLLKKHTSGKKLLDVGSGSGYFLNHMKQRGFDVTGVEISDKAKSLCFNNFGIKAFAPEDLLNEKLDRNYDLITLWHVFEHVYSYDEYFEVFKKSLSAGGKLVLALPNYTCYEAGIYDTYWAAYDTPRHLWHFEPNTLKMFAEKHGFKVKRKHRLPLDPFFNSMVSASYQPGFSFLPITLLIAKLSWIRSLFSIDRSSSIIYVLEKA